MSVFILSILFILSKKDMPFLGELSALLAACLWAGSSLIYAGDSFLFKAFQKIGARIGMLIMTLSPAISAVLAYIFLQELLSRRVIIGMIVTIFGNLVHFSSL